MVAVRLAGSVVEDVRALAEGGPALRSGHAGLVAAGFYRPIGRPDELRCGPIYVSAPEPEHAGYELDDQHLAAARHLGRLQRVAREADRLLPGAVDVLRQAYAGPPVRSLSAFDRDPSPHAVRVSAVLARWPERLASVRRLGPEPRRQLERLSCRLTARAPSPADVKAREAIVGEVTAAVARAGAAWGQARVAGRG